MANFSFTPKQLEFFQSKVRKNAFVGSIGTGKTFIGTLKALELAMNGRIVIYSLPTYGMIKSVALPMLKQHIHSFNLKSGKDFTLNLSDFDFSHKSGGMIMFRSAQIGDSVRGINAHDAVFDEIGYTDRDFYLMVLGRLRLTEDGQIYAVSSPNGKSHWTFEELIQKGDFKVVTQTIFENPFLPRAYIEDLINSYDGDFARQELLGQWVERDEADQLLSPAMIAESFTRPEIKAGGLVCGLDPSRYGDDKTAFAIRHNNHFVELALFEKTSGEDLLDLVKSFYFKHGFKTIVVDISGVGGLWLDLAKKALPEIEWISFEGARTPNYGYEHCANKRAESYQRLYNFVHGEGSFVAWNSNTKIKGALRKQMLEQRKRHHSTSGKLIMRSKEDARKEGIQSPDLIDAVAMSLCVESIHDTKSLARAIMG